MNVGGGTRRDRTGPHEANRFVACREFLGGSLPGVSRPSTLRADATFAYDRSLLVGEGHVVKTRLLVSLLVISSASVPLLPAAPAGATFPGANGRMAYFDFLQH